MVDGDVCIRMSRSQAMIGRQHRPGTDFGPCRISASGLVLGIRNRRMWWEVVDFKVEREIVIERAITIYIHSPHSPQSL